MFELFPDEEEIADKISDTLTYCTAAAKFEPTPNEKERVIAALGDGEKGKAAISDDDLYFVRSVLVSTAENKNDDVFSREDTWAARNTPSHKPTNIEHDENLLTGHIVDNWAIRSDGTMIAEGTAVEDLPDIFHIITSSVIYKQWQDDKLTERTAELIESIEAGEMFVSMECIFSKFDYGFKTVTGMQIEPRTKANAHLTKALRCYGGSGEVDGRKIYRVLRDFTFTAFGFVKKPANPKSIIFNDISEISLSSENIVDNGECQLEENDEKIDKNEKECIILGRDREDDDSTNHLNIPETDMSEDRIKELETQLAEANDKLAKIDVEKLQADKEELVAELTGAKEGLNEAKANIETLTTSNAELQTSLNEAKANADKAAEELNAMKEVALKASRVTMLVENGFDKETAEAKVELFANFNDEQFADLVQMIAKPEQIATSEALDYVVKAEDEEEQTAEAAEDALDEETEEDVNLNVASETEDDTTPEALAELINA